MNIPNLGCVKGPSVFATSDFLQDLVQGWIKGREFFPVVERASEHKFSVPFAPFTF